jgi:uncharacterized protein
MKFMKQKVNRRDFLKTTAVSLTVVAAGNPQPGQLPRRVLGKTKEQVPVLAFGGGSRFLSYQEEEGLAVLNNAIDQGINYIDTAIGYGDGRSEERIGRLMRARRGDVFLATKISDRGYEGALRAIEESLKRLQTDRVDLLHVHSLNDDNDLAEVEKGVLRALYRIKEEKMTRFIGMTSHSDARTLKTAIERHDLDCVQMALNPATHTGFATGFERIALPAALAKGVGVLAMKVTGQERLIGSGEGRAGMRDLLNYALTLPVATCVIGMPRPEHLVENLKLAKGFAPLSEADMEQLRSRVAPQAAAFDRFLCTHRDYMPA